MINSSHIIMIISNQKLELYMTKYSHIFMTNYNKNDKRSRCGPKWGLKIPWRMCLEKQKLSDMTVIILSRAIGLTWPGWGLKTVLVISAFSYLHYHISQSFLYVFLVVKHLPAMKLLSPKFLFLLNVGWHWLGIESLLKPSKYQHFLYFTKCMNTFPYFLHGRMELGFYERAM